MGREIWLRRRDVATTHPPIGQDVTKRSSNGTEGVRCPVCAWRPRPSDRWTCASAGAPEFFDAGCGTTWNTFETRGRCPGCSHQWRWTYCGRCDRWSPHEAWYSFESSDR